MRDGLNSSSMFQTTNSLNIDLADSCIHAIYLLLGQSLLEQLELSVPLKAIMMIWNELSVLSAQLFVFFIIFENIEVGDTGILSIECYRVSGNS